MQNHKYIMESATEGSRLEKKIDADDIKQQLDLAGLKPGMKALDAGAGTGAIARIMAKIVGHTGEVFALDASDARLTQGEERARELNINNLSFKQGNLLSPPFPENSFDFIWSRFVFEYFPDDMANDAMDSLISLLTPGGILAVSDIDGYLSFHDGLDPDTEQDLHKLLDGLKDEFDPYSGRKLYRRFFLKQLQQIQVQSYPYHFYPGKIPDNHLSNWKEKFSTIRSRGIEILGNTERYDALTRNFLNFLEREDSFTYSVLFLVRGTKAKD